MLFKFLFFSNLLFSLSNYSNTPTIFKGYSLGTRYNVKFDKKIKKNINIKIEKTFKKINKNLSNYNVKSKISIINMLKKKSPNKINKELNFNLISAIKIKKITNKIFNIDTKKTKKINKVINSSLFKENTKKDLSAISKGYCVDKITREINKKKIKNFLIEIGGEIKIENRKKKKKWLIGINIPENKLINKKNKITFKIKNNSIATSGTYFNFINEKNKFSHIINKKINKNILKDRLMSSTILNKNCFFADSLATYATIVGEKKIKKIKQKLKNIIYLFIYKNKNKIYIKKK